MIRLGLQTFRKLGVQQRIKSQIQGTVKTLNLRGKPTYVEFTRTTTFFNKLNAELIWKSVNTVSNAGKKRGRGKSLQKFNVNLNKGQRLGTGKFNMRWPGLNSPVIQGQDVVQLEKLPEDPEYKNKLIAARNVHVKRKKLHVHPLERGWSGRSILGKSLGPPDFIEHKEGFDSYVLETKYLKLTHSKIGKIRSVAVFVVVGNGNGLIGISSAKGTDWKMAARKAQLQASRKLFSVKLEDHTTINHDFFYQFGITKLFVYKKAPGYGVVANRSIILCCKLLGLKDLYAKVEGSKNKQNVVKAFLLGLLEQKSYQQMADENKLHLVEQRNESYMFPKVLASPKEVSSNNDLALIYPQYVMNGKLPLRKEVKPILDNMPNYEKFLKRTQYKRNHEQVKLRLLADFGKYECYLSSIYPECQPSFLIKKSKETSTDGSK